MEKLKLAAGMTGEQKRYAVEAKQHYFWDFRQRQLHFR